MLPKHWLKDYFSFTKNDRIGAIVIVFILGISLLPHFFSSPVKSFSLRQDSALVLAFDTLQQRQERKPNRFNENEGRAYQYEASANRSFTAGELFSFDPNTISLQDWQRLGLNERTSKTILHYISKGGKFYKVEDLRKIWGMPEGFYERVKAYVNITSVQRTTFPRYDDSKPQYERAERKLASVDINAADTTALIALPGIGSKLSARIIAFREKLGGFYSVAQLGETYGLPDSTFQKIRERLQVNGEPIRKLNVNTATKEDLKAHPYIRWNLANAIVEYRTQHGPFKSLEELKNISLVNEEIFEKISHYLSL